MNREITFKFENKVWIYNTVKAAWHFITLPKSLAQEINDLFGDQTKGWGSIPVEVSVGETKWLTSIFPDKKKKSYVLPLKAEVRKSENISEGKAVKVEITIGM